jgi:arylsulfatase A-like enzyme
MLRSALGGVLVLLFAAGAALANSPQVTALRQQVKALRQEESLTVKAIRARFQAIIKQEYTSEKALVQERKLVTKEEKQLLAVATTKQQKTQIRQQYAALIAVLKAGAKLDQNQIKQFRQTEKTLVAQVKAVYAAQIQQIEAQIGVLLAQEQALKNAQKAARARHR